MAMDITSLLVKRLIKEQFPQWKDEPIHPVAQQGHDHRTFRLGSKMSVRLPSGREYVSQITNEQTCLFFLAPYFPHIDIPLPIALGKPSKGYPWAWGIYNWIEGESANKVSFEQEALVPLAKEIAQFIKRLHTIPTLKAPAPGKQNFYRGSHPSIYQDQFVGAMEKLEFEWINKAKEVWKRSSFSYWHKEPVWVHGDISPANLIVKEKHLSAVIDFGLICAGDPACDLSIAWTFFDKQSREAFIQQVGLDRATWERAAAWTLWKAVITLADALHSGDPKERGIKQRAIIKEVISFSELL